MPREIDTAMLQQLLADGVSQREIARRLGIPRTTLQEHLKRQGLAVQRPPTVDVPPIHPPPSTVDQLRLDLQAAVTAALQPVLTRLEALETGQARPPSTLIQDRVHPPTVDRPLWTRRPGRCDR